MSQWADRLVRRIADLEAALADVLPAVRPHGTSPTLGGCRCEECEAYGRARRLLDTPAPGVAITEPPLETLVQQLREDAKGSDAATRLGYLIAADRIEELIDEVSGAPRKEDK